MTDGEANSAKIAEIRARAEDQRRYQEVELLNDWPVADVLALVEVAEAAADAMRVRPDAIPDGSFAIASARLEQALSKFDFSSEEAS